MTDAAERRGDALAAVTVAYTSVMLREPDAAAAVYVDELASGDIDAPGLLTLLRDSAEHRDIVSPLVARVRAAYRLLFDREPSRQELRAHAAGFRQRFSSDAAAVAQLQQRHCDDLLGIRPINLEMDITNQCNLRCVMCYFSDPAVGSRKRQDITRAQYERVAEGMFSWTNRVCLSFGAEATLHPELASFVRLAKKREVPKVYFNTNGMLLRPGLMTELLDAGIDALNVSVDAGTEATYERVRRGGRWQTLIDNLQWLKREKQRRATRAPHVNLSFIMMRSTQHEVTDFVGMAADVGADSIHLSHLLQYDNLGMEGEALRADPGEADRTVREAAALARQLGMQAVIPDAMSSPGEPQRIDLPRARSNFDLPLSSDGDSGGCCPFPWHFVALDFDGSTVPCGWWHSGPRMGNLFVEDFAEVWQGPAYRKLRWDLQRRVLDPNCQRCPAGGMGSAGHAQSFAVRPHDWRKALP